MGKNKFGKLVALSAVIGSGAWVYKKYETIKSMYHKVSIFKGERYEFDEFDGEAIAAMFSGVVVDLSNVEFVEDEVYLDIYALCSGIRILIPKDVEIVLEGSNKASGVQVDQDDDITKTKTLYINYNITASGLLITDNIDECCDDECCDDPECNDPDCCSTEETEEEIKAETEEIEAEIEEEIEEIEAEIEEKIEEEIEAKKKVEKKVEIKAEKKAETSDEVVGNLNQEVEAFAETQEVEKFQEVNKENESIEPELDELVERSASELGEAAAELDEAIKEFVDNDDDFESFDKDDHSKDDFFE